MKSERKYFQDILERIERLENIAVDGHEVFMRDVILQDAAAYSFEVIGEIIKRLPEQVLERGKINPSQYNDLSDFLAHNYDQNEATIVWRAVEQLSQLREAVEVLLKMSLEGE